MQGDQVGFDYKNKIDFSDIHKALLDRLSISEIIYNYDNDEINSLTIQLFKVLYNDRLEKIPKTLFKYSDLVDLPNKDLLNSIIPYNTNTKNYGTILKPSIVYNTKVIMLDNINILESINSSSHNKPKLNLDENTKIILTPNSKHLLVVKETESDNLIKNEIGIYKPSGLHLTTVKDSFIRGRTDSFTRVLGNTTNVLENSKVVSTFLNVKLSNIKPNLFPKTLYHLNTFVGTLDTETYKTSSGSKVYALGFYTAKHGTVNLYIDSKLDSEKLILDCFDLLLTYKYVFYVHNLGNYDDIFLLKVLQESDKYKLSIIAKDNRILSLTIKTKKNDKNSKVYSIKLVDSYNILNSSLRKLALTYKTEIFKGYFPYEFITL